MPNLYARAGETATCENGHALGTFKRDVVAGDIINLAEDQILEPGVAVGLDKCPVCGGKTIPAGGCMFFGAGNPRMIPDA